MENPVIFSAPVISFAKVACAIQLSALQREVDYLVQNPWVDRSSIWINTGAIFGGATSVSERCEHQCAGG